MSDITDKIKMLRSQNKTGHENKIIVVAVFRLGDTSRKYTFTVFVEFVEQN